MKSFKQILLEEVKFQPGSLGAAIDYKPLTIDDFPREKQNIESYPENSRERKRAEEDFNNYLQNINNRVSSQLNMEPAEVRGRGTRNARAEQSVQERYEHILNTTKQTTQPSVSNHINGSYLMNQEEQSGVKKMAGANIAITAGLLLSPILIKGLLPKLGTLLAKYGIKNLAKGLLEKLLQELWELFKSIFEQEEAKNGGSTPDQLLQMDVQAILMRAQNEPNDQFSQNIISRVSALAQTQIQSQQPAQKQEKEPNLQESSFQKILEFSLPNVAKAVPNFIGKASNTVNKVLDGISPQQQQGQNQGNDQLNRMKTSPQQQTLTGDLQNLLKKCKLVNSDYSKQVLTVISGLIQAQ
jgi:hypothetical protein